MMVLMGIYKLISIWSYSNGSVRMATCPLRDSYLHRDSCLSMACFRSYVSF